MKNPLLRLAFISLLARQAAPNTAWAQVKAAPPIAGVLGAVQSITDGHSKFRPSQAWSRLISANPSQLISRYRRI
jgi:hypothetical protein